MSLQDDVSIKLIDTKDHLLSCYDRAISDYTGAFFKRQGIQVLSESHVRPASHAVRCLHTWAGMQTLCAGIESTLDCALPRGVRRHKVMCLSARAFSECADWYIYVWPCRWPSTCCCSVYTAAG